MRGVENSLTSQHTTSHTAQICETSLQERYDWKKCKGSDQNGWFV